VFLFLLWSLVPLPSSLQRSFILALQSLVVPLLFRFRSPEHGRTPWKGDQHVTRPLPTNRTAQTLNKRTQTSMPLVRFEPMTPLLERAKTVHDLGHMDTVIGHSCI
jgi:hypothetical protein